MHWLERHWYRRGLVSLLLLPAAALYCALVGLRRMGYRLGWLRTVHVPAPVIVVGNITVGGSGKTPLVIWLAGVLKQRNLRPGIVTRGYGGRARDWPRDVRADSDPEEVGDEPVLLARAAGCPVVADPDRVRGAQRLVRTHGCDVIVSDDGLQHYRLARAVEIAVIDGARRFGNGFCLPAGPLREPVGRLRHVHAVVTQGEPQAGELGMALIETGFTRLGTRAETAEVSAFRGRTAHAVAGIGNPARFFDHLRRLGVEVIEHPFPDHHPYTPADLEFGDRLPVLMTAKDAVKCERFADERCWVLAVEAHPDPRLADLVPRILKERRGG